MNYQYVSSQPEYGNDAQWRRLARFGFRGLHDKNGLFEGFGRRLPGGMTVYAIDKQGEPGLIGPFNLVIRGGNPSTFFEAAVARGGELALKQIRYLVGTWVRYQIVHGHPAPLLAVSSHLKAHRFLEETHSQKIHFQQAGKALKLAASLLEDRNDDASRELFKGCMSAAAKCLQEDHLPEIKDIQILLAQLSRHFTLALTDNDLSLLIRMRSQATGDMLHQLMEHGQKFPESQE